ncbi:MAG: hypothetical protein ACOCSL_02480 [Thermoplasmatota archaeon]
MCIWAQTYLAKSKGVHITADSSEYDRIILPIFDSYPIEKLIRIIPNEIEEYPTARKLTEHYVSVKRGIQTRQTYPLTLKRFDGAESIKFLLKKIEDSRKPVERSTLQYRIKNLPDLKLIEIERYDRKLRLDLTRLGKIFLEGL